MRTYPLIIGGRRVDGEAEEPVCDKFTGEVVARIATASDEHVAAAAASAWERFAGDPLPPWRRAEILEAAAVAVEERRDELADAFVSETGFTLREAQTDIARTIDTLELSAHEATRIAGEVVPFAGARNQEHRLGFTLKLPIGPVCAITPFNSPLNTVAHKVGPALAAGNPVVLKPASATPVTAFMLCEALEQAGLPDGWLNLVFGSGATVGRALVDDPRFRFYAFTGSTEVGEQIQRGIGLRRSQMELGAICATIVCADADVERVTARAAPAAFRKAGQVCTSMQRLLVHESIAGDLVNAMAAETETWTAGDPRHDGTRVGPMIAEREAERAETWVRAAVDAGAIAHSQVERRGPVLAPVLLSDVAPDMDVVAREIFAPVVSVSTFSTLEEAFSIVNGTPYGLSAAIFTSDWRTAMCAAHELDVGVVQVDDTSSSRVDLMPYGGLRASGFGKEGPRYAVEEMSIERLVVFNR